MVAAKLFAYSKPQPGDSPFFPGDNRGEIVQATFSDPQGSHFLDTTSDGRWVEAGGWEAWSRQRLNDNEYGNEYGVVAMYPDNGGQPYFITINNEV
jgi:hypothetical protein